MKKLIIAASLLMAVLQTGCGLTYSVKKTFGSGFYEIATAKVKDGATVVTLVGVKGAFLLPGDTLKPGKKIWITYMQKSQ